MVAESCLDLVTVAEPALGIGIGQQSRASQKLAEARHLTHRQSEMAIRGGIDAVGSAEIRVGIVHGAPVRGLATVVEMGGDDLELQVENGFHETHLNPSAATRDTPSNEASENALHQVGAGGEIRDGEPHRHGISRCIPAEPSEAGHGLGKKVLSGFSGPWPLGAVTCDGGVDEAGVDGFHSLVTQAELFHHAGAEIFHQHIRCGDQLANGDEVFRVLEIGGEALLIPVDRVEKRAVAFHS